MNVGYSYNTNRKKKMTQLKNFYITYFAKTHNGKEYVDGVKMITRKAQEPNPKGTAGKMFTDKNGTDRYVYWDLEARDKKTNELGAWRHATGKWNIKAV